MKNSTDSKNTCSFMSLDSHELYSVCRIFVPIVLLTHKGLVFEAQRFLDVRHKELLSCRELVSTVVLREYEPGCTSWVT